METTTPQISPTPIQPEMQTPMTPKSQQNMSVPISIIIAGMIIAGAIFFTNGKNAANTDVAGGQAPQVTIDSAKIPVAGSPVVGNPNAAVTVVYYFDYQCPFCKQVENTVTPQLMKEYVATGKVKIVYKDFEFLGPDSLAASIFARAVWEASPDQYSAWHSAMFEKQDKENSGWGNKDDILALLKTVPGIDAAKVETLYNTKQEVYTKMIDADKSAGAKLGVSGTPAFLIGKQKIDGAQPYSAIKQAIEDTLSGK